MSRGFVKEDDQEEPPFVAPRAALPAGVENYVTENGFEELKREKESLLAARKENDGLSDRDKRRENAVIDAKIQQLDERIDNARIVPAIEDAEEVRFGVKVRFKIKGTNKSQTFQIVGVDEANIRKGKVAFTAPLIQKMMGKKPGEYFEFDLQGRATEYIVEEVWV